MPNRNFATQASERLQQAIAAGMVVIQEGHEPHKSDTLIAIYQGGEIEVLRGADGVRPAAGYAGRDYLGIE